MNINFYGPITIGSCLKYFDYKLIKEYNSTNGKLDFNGSLSDGTKYCVEYERRGNYSIGLNLKFGSNYEVDILAYFDEDENKYEPVVSISCIINRCKAMFGLDVDDKFVCYNSKCSDFVNEFIKEMINDPEYVEHLKDNK